LKDCSTDIILRLPLDNSKQTNDKSTFEGTAEFLIAVASSVSLGAYPLSLNFTNDNKQFATCSFTVRVEGAAQVTKTIPEIQGSDATSPFANTIQSTSGVVTLIVSDGFYLQDAAGDGNLATSDGIFVFSSTIPSIVLGDLVRLTATGNINYLLDF
jgi:predicted extracellular nuclease